MAMNAIQRTVSSHACGAQINWREFFIFSF